MSPDREQDAVQRRMDDLAGRVDELDGRIGRLEERADLDRLLLSQLQADGLLSRRRSDQLEEALLSSRKIGIALGIVMMSRKVTDKDAFDFLTDASNRTNRKLSDLADEIVLTGEVPKFQKR